VCVAFWCNLESLESFEYQGGRKRKEEGGSGRRDGSGSRRSVDLPAGSVLLNNRLKLQTEGTTVVSEIQARRRRFSTVESAGSAIEIEGIWGFVGSRKKEKQVGSCSCGRQTDRERETERQRTGAHGRAGLELNRSKLGSPS
jgi:hypothetical protein